MTVKQKKKLKLLEGEAQSSERRHSQQDIAVSKLEFDLPSKARAKAYENLGHVQMLFGLV